ncbi:hypothetical protein C789_5173 [Microcystis aeruginosa FACHB-905 = DIANCHI905]|nr:hypothetical protein C789_5173 [Microcystis aeruginosa FACHB-905 = DIANCHI905]
MVSHDYYLNFGVIRYIFAFYSVVRIREIGVRIREIGVRSQESGDYFYLFSPHSIPHYPTTPLPHTPISLMIAKKLHQEGNNFQ